MFSIGKRRNFIVILFLFEILRELHAEKKWPTLDINQIIIQRSIKKRNTMQQFDVNGNPCPIVVDDAGANLGADFGANVPIGINAGNQAAWAKNGGPVSSSILQPYDPNNQIGQLAPQGRAYDIRDVSTYPNTFDPAASLGASAGGQLSTGLKIPLVHAIRPAAPFGYPGCDGLVPSKNGHPTKKAAAQGPPFGVPKWEPQVKSANAPVQAPGVNNVLATDQFQTGQAMVNNGAGRFSGPQNQFTGTVGGPNQFSGSVNPTSQLTNPIMGPQFMNPPNVGAQAPIQPIQPMQNFQQQGIQPMIPLQQMQNVASPQQQQGQFVNINQVPVRNSPSVNNING